MDLSQGEQLIFFQSRHPWELISIFESRPFFKRDQTNFDRDVFPEGEYILLKMVFRP